MNSFALTVLCMILFPIFITSGLNLSIWAWIFYVMLVICTVWSYTPVARRLKKESLERQQEYERKWLSRENSNFTAKKQSSTLDWSRLFEAIGRGILESQTNSRVHVRSYRRKDGTNVRSHYRRK